MCLSAAACAATGGRAGRGMSCRKDGCANLHVHRLDHVMRDTAKNKEERMKIQNPRRLHKKERKRMKQERMKEKSNPRGRSVTSRGQKYRLGELTVWLTRECSFFVTPCSGERQLGGGRLTS